MTTGQLQGLSVDELVERFVSNALDQDQAILLDDNRKYRRLYFEMKALKEALKGRAGDQRTALLPLLKHRNAQVRLKAAIATLAVEIDTARAALQKISDANEYPQAADARGMMSALDEGRYVPS